MRTLALWLIALTLIAQNLAIYESEDGGTNIYFGQLGYHLEDN